ncbi:hypothetical protein WA026_013352 [Henosepilachna vigintioctopunctata]|uniref:Acyltransferase 3 domain-containing protein n=1 Tax=Henosepilachna vigintioctopunctata TaxID=420089 RepID=A0AAW1V6V0_9CUCU
MSLINYLIVWFYSVNSIFQYVECTDTTRHPHESILPEIYNSTNEYECPKGHLYCKLTVTLRPIDEKNPPEVWKTIEEINENGHYKYRRDMIYRTVCEEKNGLTEEYNEYSSYGLIGIVDHRNCFEVGAKESITNYDIFVGVIVTLYISYFIYCNVQMEKIEGPRGKNLNQANKYMEVFYVRNAWKELNNVKRGDDFQKLLFIQGIRTITICVVILAHHSLKLLVTFNSNPEYVEQYFSGPYSGFLIQSFGHVVQIFFVISAWLLAVQLHNIIKKNGKITFKDVLIILLNRYCRLLPHTLVIVLMHSSSIWEIHLSKLLYRYVVSLEYQRCLAGWWQNLLFIQNWSCFNGEICSPGTWYLAVDTQLFFIVTLFFYFSHKLKIHIRYFLGITVFLAVGSQVHTVMTTTFDGLLHFTPRLMPVETSFNQPEFVYSYSTTAGSLVTYVIGFVFGTFYAENKERDIFNTTLKKILWISASLGLPLISIKCYSYALPRIVEAIMTVTLRPLFGLGIAIAILGMATNTGGYVKKFLQSKPLVVLGNITFCVYMFHFAVIFSSLMLTTEMVTITDSYFWITLILDIVSAFFVGLLLFIVVEYPCTRLQKMFLPQVKMVKAQSKERTS